MHLDISDSFTLQEEMQTKLKLLHESLKCLIQDMFFQWTTGMEMTEGFFPSQTWWNCWPWRNICSSGKKTKTNSTPTCSVPWKLQNDLCLYFIATAGEQAGTAPYLVHDQWKDKDKCFKRLLNSFSLMLTNTTFNHQVNMYFEPR